jgi:hypothetical protein
MWLNLGRRLSSTGIVANPAALVKPARRVFAQKSGRQNGLHRATILSTITYIMMDVIERRAAVPLKG